MRRRVWAPRRSWPRRNLARTPINAACNNPGEISRIGSNSRGCEATRAKKAKRTGKHRHATASLGDSSIMATAHLGLYATSSNRYVERPAIARCQLPLTRQLPFVNFRFARQLSFVNFRSRVNFHSSNSASRVNFRPGGGFGIGSLYQNRSLQLTFASV